MVYKSKAQIQAELVGMAEVMFVASLDDDGEEADMDVDFEGEDQWLLDDMDPEDDALQYVALRVLESAQSMSGSGSRGPYNGIARSKDYFPTLLQQPDQRFRYVFRSVNNKCLHYLPVPDLKDLVFRLSRSTFDRLVALLADNPIFISRGKRPQRHVKFQLAAFLMRYGRLGSSALAVAMELSIGEGTVFLYCNRVSRALRQLKSRFLGWPDPARKEVISTVIEQAAGFQKCLGSGDGCLIRFTQQPLQFGHMYKCRKQFFGVCYLLVIAMVFLTISPDKYPNCSGPFTSVYLI